jgi:hypothetical protein
MTENQRLVLSTLDESCAKRKAAIAMVPSDQSGNSTAEGVPSGTGATDRGSALLGMSTGGAVAPLSETGGFILSLSVMAAFVYIGQTSTENDGDRENISPASF